MKFNTIFLVGIFAVASFSTVKVACMEAPKRPARERIVPEGGVNPAVYLAPRFSESLVKAPARVAIQKNPPLPAEPGFIQGALDPIFAEAAQVAPQQVFVKIVPLPADAPVGFVADLRDAFNAAPQPNPNNQ